MNIENPRQREREEEEVGVGWEETSGCVLVTLWCFFIATKSAEDIDRGAHVAGSNTTVTKAKRNKRKINKRCFAAFFSLRYL